VWSNANSKSWPADVKSCDFPSVQLSPTHIHTQTFSAFVSPDNFTAFPQVNHAEAARYQVVPVCFQCRSSVDDQSVSSTSTYQSRHLSIFGHMAQINENTDAKKILFALPLEGWKRLPVLWTCEASRFDSNQTSRFDSKVMGRFENFESSRLPHLPSYHKQH